MQTFIQIATTTDSHDAAVQIARRLVERRLAACAQVTGPILSFYEWNGQQEESAEWRCEAKTVADLLPQIEKLLAEEHAYEVPQLVATPISGGSAAYLSWLEAQVQTT